MLAEDGCPLPDESLDALGILSAAVHAYDRLGAARAHEHPGAVVEVEAEPIDIADSAMMVVSEVPPRGGESVCDALLPVPVGHSLESKHLLPPVEHRQFVHEFVDRLARDCHDLEHHEERVERVVAERVLAEAELLRRGLAVEGCVVELRSRAGGRLAHTAELDPCARLARDVVQEGAGADRCHAQGALTEHPLAEDAGHDVAVERSLCGGDEHAAIAVSVERDAEVVLAVEASLRCRDRVCAVLGRALAPAPGHFLRIHVQARHCDAEHLERAPREPTHGAVAGVHDDAELPVRDRTPCHVEALPLEEVLHVQGVLLFKPGRVRSGAGLNAVLTHGHDRLVVREPGRDEVRDLARRVGAVRVDGDDTDAIVRHVRAGDEYAPGVPTVQHRVGE